MQRLKHTVNSFTQVIVVIFFTILLVLSSNNIAFAQFVQQGDKLLGAGALGPAEQGRSVAVSADGNTAIVGGPSYNGGVGAAWVYTRSGGVWNLQGEKLTSNIEGQVQGYSVAISDDGNTVLVGGGDAARVFTRTDGIWTQQGNNITPTDDIGNSSGFGASVALSSDDGNTAIIGGPNEGAVWIFTRTGETWSQQGSKLQRDGKGASESYGGASVDLSADGNIAVVGGPADASGDGAVWTFKRTAGTWTQQSLINSPNPNSEFGYSVSLSSDGNTVLIGEGAHDNTLSGTCAAWLYTRQAGQDAWDGKSEKRLVGVGDYNNSGESSVALSADGSMVIIGAPNLDDNSGKDYIYNAGGVFIFQRNPDGSYSQQGSKLLGTGMIGAVWGGPLQGYSVALSTDGNTIISGGNFDDNRNGAAWAFYLTNGSWAQQAKLVSTGNIGPASQGQSVAVSADGNTAIVGGDKDNGEIGAAWIFTRSGGIWTQQGDKLVGTGEVFLSAQGNSVAISDDGNTVIIGGPGDDGDKGAAWIFTRSGSTWTQQGSKLVGTGGSIDAQQGFSVSLSADGNTAIIGGPLDAEGVGAAWVFTRSGSTWTQQGSKLVGTGFVQVTNGDVLQGFSVSLSADGNTAIIGGPGDDGFTGAVWVFTRTGGVWTQPGNKIAPVGKNSDDSQFGHSVSLSADGNTAIVGGPNSTSGYGEGAVWEYTRSAGVWGYQALLTGGSSQAYFGSSVSLSSDGNLAVIGGSEYNSGEGAAWVFTKSNGTWTGQSNKLIGTGNVGAAKQGTSVSVSDDGHTVIVGGPTGEGAAWVFVNTHFNINLTLFLEGPFNTTNMNANLDLSSQLTQPYTSMYSGTESVASGFFTSHTDIVDWVLVELRTGTDASTKAAARACFIKSDGSIVDLDGSSAVDFIGLDPAITEYYAVVYHRNHLPVMSSIPVQVN